MSDFLNIPHWSVAGTLYTNQFQAWQKAAAAGVTPKFCLFDEAFDQLDWTKDPKESWDSLLHARCLQLRQKHKHLVLLYSGGRDSHCILRAFVRFKIPIDELIVIHWERNPVRDLEARTWMLPMAQGYLEYNPSAKITTLSVGVEDYKKWFTESWSERGSSILHGQFQPSDLSWIVQEKAKIKHSSTGVVCGLEKPWLVLKDNKLYAHLDDKRFLHYFHNLRLMEFFYVSPDLPELHLKQSRLLVNHLREHYSHADSSFINQFQNPNSGYYDELCMATGRGPAVDITSPAQNGKNKYFGNHPVFQVLKKIIQNEAPSVWHQYKENVDFFFAKTPLAIDRDDYFWTGIRTLTSKLYYLCDWPFFQKK